MTAMTSTSNARFVRWQERSNTQLGFINNTVLALTTAALGLAVSSNSPGWQLCTLRFGTVLLILSVFLALGCALNRLWDFRVTAQIARGNMNEEDEAAARREAGTLSCRTWTLLYFQLGTFALGALSLVVALRPS